jgi:hypothetical protein
MIIVNEREVFKMFVALFEIESLAWCPVVGIIMIAAMCLHFMLMMGYAIVAECGGLPMPLDDRYLIGKINGTIMMTLMVGGLAFFII